MMNISSQTYCHCDECDKKLIMSNTTKTRFIYRARLAYGWSVGKKIVCANCKHADNPRMNSKTWSLEKLEGSDSEGEFL